MTQIDTSLLIQQIATDMYITKTDQPVNPKAIFAKQKVNGLWLLITNDYTLLIQTNNFDITSKVDDLPHDTTFTSINDIDLPFDDPFKNIIIPQTYSYSIQNPDFDWDAYYSANKQLSKYMQ